MEEELKGLLGFCPLTISVIRSRYFLNWLCSAVVPKIVFPAAAWACWSDCYCKCLISAGSWFETCASLRTALLISAPKHKHSHIIVINSTTAAQPDSCCARLTCEEAREELQDALVHLAEWGSSHCDEFPHRLLFPNAQTTRHFF